MLQGAVWRPSELDRVNILIFSGAHASFRGCVGEENSARWKVSRDCVCWQWTDNNNNNNSGGGNYIINLPPSNYPQFAINDPFESRFRAKTFTSGTWRLRWRGTLLQHAAVRQQEGPEPKVQEGGQGAATFHRREVQSERCLGNVSIKEC